MLYLFSTPTHFYKVWSMSLCLCIEQEKGNLSRRTASEKRHAETNTSCPTYRGVCQETVHCTYNQPARSKIPGAPVTMVNTLQLLMAYAHADKAMIPKANPIQTRPPAAPRWRIPENSVVNTKAAML